MWVQLLHVTLGDMESHWENSGKSISWEKVVAGTRKKGNIEEMGHRVEAWLLLTQHI